jgi:glycosyltransferase involved in cell wall biosynthesis
MKFSIIIVTFNRKNELENCLNSLLSQKINVPYEVIIIYNGEISYAAKMKNTFTNLKSVSIPASTPAHARNVGIKEASGEYLFFLDDDCLLPEDYFTKVQFNEGWDILGGPDRTPPDASPLQNLIGLALSSPFCMGPTFRRHSSTLKQVDHNADESELILCNLWIKREIFSNEAHKFEESLFRNEENFLLKELKLQKKIIFYDPNLYVYHLRKSTLEKLAKAIIKSGECRTQNYLKLPVTSELLYFTPIIFTLFFISWIFNLNSFLTVVFASYFLTAYIYGVAKLRTYHWGFTGLHLFILIFYTWGLSRELCTQTIDRIRKLIN